MVGNIDSQAESVQKELTEEQEVTKVHDQNSSIVFESSPAFLLVDQGESTNGDDASDDHLQDLCDRDPLRSEPLGLAFDRH